MDKMMELKDTVALMNSGDYKERFKAEYYQNAIRYQKLRVMMDAWNRGELKFEPTCPKSTYNLQLTAMTDYLAVLEARAVMEGISLDAPVVPEAATPSKNRIILNKVMAAPTDWGSLIAGICDGSTSLKMGDTVSCTLLDGREVDFVVTEDAEDHVRFESVECLGTTSHEDDAMEAFLDGIWGVLPDDLKKHIMSTERRYLDRDGELVTEDCKLFLPSASEVFPEDSCYGDEGVYEQMSWYKDRRHRIRLNEKNGKPCCWWTLSAYSGASTYFVYVIINGAVNSNSASNTWLSAPVCFQIPKSR